MEVSWSCQRIGSKFHELIPRTIVTCLCNVWIEFGHRRASARVRWFIIVGNVLLKNSRGGLSFSFFFEATWLRSVSNKCAILLLGQLIQRKSRHLWTSWFQEKIQSQSVSRIRVAICLAAGVHEKRSFAPPRADDRDFLRVLLTHH